MASESRSSTDGRVGQDLSGPQVALAADVDLGELVGDPLQPCEGGEHLQAFGDHLGPDPIPRHDAELDQRIAPRHPDPIEPRRRRTRIVTDWGLRRRMRIRIGYDSECLDAAQVFVPPRRIECGAAPVDAIRDITRIYVDNPIVGNIL